MGRYHIILMTAEGEKLKHETDDLQEALDKLTSTSVKVIDCWKTVEEDTPVD